MPKNRTENCNDVCTGNRLAIFQNLSLCRVKQTCRGYDARESIRWSRVYLRWPHEKSDFDIIKSSEGKLSEA